ncbi:MAG: nucleoside hydrolase [Candidatus Nanopelagicales bacterium]
MTGRPIIIDTDPGVDDALAIMLTAASPEVDVLGIIAVAGNVGLDKTSANAAALADLVGLGCPIGLGASGPLGARDAESAEHVHGGNGLGGYVLPPSSRAKVPGLPLLVSLIEASTEPVTVVTIGPLTDIALLMAHHPDAARQVERFIVMGGGTLDVPGNATPAAEFNFYADPEAAARVFAFGTPITMVGLNATHQALVGPEHLPRLRQSGGRIAHLVEHILADYERAGYGMGGAMEMHDPLAVAVAIDPTLVSTAPRHVDIEDAGRLTAGMAVVDHRYRPGSPPNADLAVTVDVPRFRTMLDERLAELDQRIFR